MAAPAFGPLSALFRDTERPCAVEAEVAWYAQRIGTEALALDAMCGWGRLLAPLTVRGCKVHGVDASAAMLARCDANTANALADPTVRPRPAADAGPASAGTIAATTFRQDIVDLNLPFRYGVAFIADGAFQLLTDPTLAAAALARLRAHLVAPGVLYVACRVPPVSVQRLGAPLVEVRTVNVRDGTRITLRSESTWTEDAHMANAAHRYSHRRGAQPLAEEHERIAATWYSRDEGVALVQAAGFTTVAVETGPECADEGDAFVVVARG